MDSIIVNTMQNKRVVVAMSGGVDSSVAAALLKDKGYEVIGITMRLWPKSLCDSFTKERTCCSLSDIEDARRVSERLHIPFYVINLEKEFKEYVIDYFVQQYCEGKTPNPCIVCNEAIKFGSLLNKAQALGADYVATGHYARLYYNSKNKRFCILEGVDKKKDQSYVLFRLSQEQLAHTLLPLGGHTKDEVRKLAKRFKLPVCDKPDSQELCFVLDGNYNEFIKGRLNQKVTAGDIVDKDRNVLGKHKGLHCYTIGQRHNLGISVGRPVYVIDIDAEKNIIAVGDKRDLQKTGFTAFNLNWVSILSLNGKPVRVKAKIRSNHPKQYADIIKDADRVRVIFKSPQSAITPGQAVVFYDGETVLGGGWIEKGKIKE